MPMVWFDGIQLYCDYETEYEKRRKIKQIEYQRNYRFKKKYNITKPKKIQSNKLKEKYICDCGGSYWFKTSKYNHVKSKKHLNYIENNKFQDNLTTETEVIET